MKTLALERMELIEGGSCGWQIVATIGIGFLIAAGPAGWLAAAGAAALGAYQGQQVYDACFK